VARASAGSGSHVAILQPPTGREPQIILKTDQRTFVLELALGGKFQAKSSGCDENRMFLEGDVLEVAVRNGR